MSTPPLDSSEKKPVWSNVSLREAHALLFGQLAMSSQSLDPYVIWYYVTHPNEFDFGKKGVPIAIEFKPGSKWQQDPRLELVPEHFRRGNGHFGTARIHSDSQGNPAHSLLLRLMGKEYEDVIKRVRLGRAWSSPGESSPPADDEQPSPLPGPVVAVIDDGCAFAHERFRFQDSAGKWHTRIKYFWDQNERSTENADLAPCWRKVKGFGYGYELDQAKIDQLIGNRNLRGVVDEAGVYRDARYRGADSKASHGTHVLDLAAGAPPVVSDEGVMPSIIFVQLPRNAVFDTSGGWMNAYVLDALWYVHTRVAPEAKLVVNLSFGAMAGPHDGSSILEAAMDALFDERKTNFALVIPAGNAFEADCRAVVKVPPGEKKSLKWHIRRDDPTDTFMELWYDKTPEIDIELLTPRNVAEPLIAAPNSAKVLRDASGRVQGAVVHLSDGGSPGRSRAVIMTTPADTQHRDIGSTPAGTWEVIIHNKSKSAAAQVDAWMERDDRAQGDRHPSRRQAHFVSDEPTNDHCRPGAPLCRKGTLNSIANGKRPIVVGGCVGSTTRKRDRTAGDVSYKVARYSGGGAASSMGRSPDVVAVSDESSTLFGIKAAGSRSGYRVRLQGTSVAAPQVARWIMDHLIKSPIDQTIDQIRAELVAVAKRRLVEDTCDPGSPGFRTGAGCVDEDIP